MTISDALRADTENLADSLVDAISNGNLQNAYAVVYNFEHMMVDVEGGLPDVNTLREQFLDNLKTELEKAVDQERETMAARRLLKPKP